MVDLGKPVFCAKSLLPSTLACWRWKQRRIAKARPTALTKLGSWSSISSTMCEVCAAPPALLPVGRLLGALRAALVPTLAGDATRFMRSAPSLVGRQLELG